MQPNAIPNNTAIESTAAVEKIYALAQSDDLINSPKWLATEGGATLIQTSDDIIIIAQSKGSSNAKSKNYSYFIADRWERNIVSSFDCAIPPGSIRFISLNPPTLENAQIIRSPASISIGEISQNLLSYFADRNSLDISQLKEHASISPPPPANNLSLSRRAAQPKGVKDLFEVVDICLEACNRLENKAADAAALSTYLSIASWCLQNLSEEKLRQGEISIASLTKRSKLFSDFINVFIEAAKAGGEASKDLQARSMLLQKKVYIIHTLIDDYREITSDQDAAIAPHQWQGSREIKIRQEAKESCIPKIVSDGSEMMKKLLSEFKALEGGSNSNNLHGELRLFSSRLARIGKSPTVVSWHYSPKPLGVLINGHTVVGFQGGQIGIPGFESKALLSTYDSLELKNPRFDSLRAMIIWAPDELKISVNPAYAQQYYDTSVASKSIFEL